MSTVAAILASVAALAGVIWAAVTRFFPAVPPGKVADQPITDVHNAIEAAEDSDGDTSAIENEISK